MKMYNYKIVMLDQWGKYYSWSRILFANKKAQEAQPNGLTNPL